MGLAGRKEKQRIGEDPRNTRWANDTSNPGFKLLAAMGYSAETTRTLGPATAHQTTWKRLPTALVPSTSMVRTETLGLGAKPQGAMAGFLPGGGGMSFVAAGKDGELDEAAKAKKEGGGLGDLLARLNKAKEAGAVASGSATPVESSAVESSGVEDEEEDPKVAKKARKAARAAKREAKHLASVDSTPSTNPPSPPSAPTPPLTASGRPIINPRMASRAKHLRSKRLATSSNSAAMAEILGLDPSTSLSLGASPAASGLNTPATEPSEAMKAITESKFDRLTTSLSFPMFVKSEVVPSADDVASSTTNRPPAFVKASAEASVYAAPPPMFVKAADPASTLPSSLPVKEVTTQTPAFIVAPTKEKKEKKKRRRRKLLLKLSRQS